ncbi:MAG: ThiF family adenylyltransferase [Myxococcales bacterium]
MRHRRAVLQPGLGVRLSGSVAIVGVGGLGCPAALALARAGISPIGLFDPDRVEPSNLPRQILFGDGDVGRPKVEVTAERLRALGSVEITARPIEIRDESAAELASYPVWIDGTDGLTTKLWLSDLAMRGGHTLLHAGAVRLRGQLLAIAPGRGPCLRCLVDGEEAGVAGEATCRQAGILGPVVGVLGSLLALFAAAALRGEDVAGRLVTFDAATGALRERRIQRRSDCAVCARVADAEADVTSDVCPMTFVRARLALERLAPGGRLGVLVRGEEPVANLPRSFAEEGHRVLSIEPREGGRHYLLVEKAIQ